MENQRHGSPDCFLMSSEEAWPMGAAREAFSICPKADLML